jgi:hypothetical protein
MIVSAIRESIPLRVAFAPQTSLSRPTDSKGSFQGFLGESSYGGQHAYLVQVIQVLCKQT